MDLGSNHLGQKERNHTHYFDQLYEVISEIVNCLLSNKVMNPWFRLVLAIVETMQVISFLFSSAMKDAIWVRDESDSYLTKVFEVFDILEQIKPAGFMVL